MKPRILFVDDEPDILEILKYNFEKEGYIVYTANNGSEGLLKAKKHQPHLIILDVMMPEIDGIETCRLLREIPEFAKTIILFLTARNEEYSELAGFNAGADDYVFKPIRPRTLIARVKSLLKRQKNVEDTIQPLHFGDLFINPEERLVKIKNETIKLPRKEFDLLLLLASKPEKVFTREKIFSKIWGDDVIVGDRTLDVHIRKLRKKIGKDYIRTSKGIGYSMRLL
ncbi:MAG: response regulator transcription factor [Flavobacteriaceae bacterium]